MSGGGEEVGLAGNHAVTGTGGYGIHRNEGGGGVQRGRGQEWRGRESARGGFGGGWRCRVGWEKPGRRQRE